MKLRSVIAAAALCAALLCVAGCDESAMLYVTQTASYEPSPAQTEAPPAAATPPAEAARPLAPLVEPIAGTPVPSSPVPTPEPSPTLAPSPAAPAPVPLTALEASAAADLDGDGRRDTIIPQPRTAEPTVVWTINGLEYDTGIPAGADSDACYVQDIDSDGASELILVRGTQRGAELYLFRLGEAGLQSASFTYTLPPELSETGAEELRENSQSLVFSGIEPVISLGDGSFAVLTFGSGFARYVLGPDMRVTQGGTLPIDILTGGQVPPVQPAQE